MPFGIVASHTVTYRHKMRTKTLLLTAAAVAAGLVSSQAQNVYSANVVGYVNTSLAGPSEYTLVANPLDSGNNVFSNLLQSLPVGAQVLKWDPVGATYVGATRVSFGNGWSPTTAATNTFNPGEAVFIKTTSSGPVTNTFVGNVEQGNLTNSYGVGYTLTGNLVPDSGGATNTSINLAPPTGTQLLFWDPVAQTYVGYTKTSFGAGWTPSVPNLTPANGFFIKLTTPYAWGRSFTVQ